MFLELCILTGLVVAFGCIHAYYLTSDGTHPAIFMAPTFAFMYSFSPFFANSNGTLEIFFSTDDLDYVALLCLLTIVCLYIGLLQGARKLPRNSRISWNLNLSLSPSLRRKLFSLAVILGALSVAAYGYELYRAGGFAEAYGQVKGGGHAGSGYIGEALNLSFPAIILLALARQRLKFSWADIALAIVIVSPHLLQGTFGGRRGPLFLSLAILFFAWFLARGKLPSLKTGLIAVCAIGFAVILVWSQRHHLYIGSEEGFKSDLVSERIYGEEVDVGNTYVAGAAAILVADYFGHFYWGYRYLVTFIIRPIPKQLWPEKYEDMGADWLFGFENEARNERFLEVVGFAPPPGVAIGSIADGYLEFWWGVLLLFYLIGRFYSLLWRRHRLFGGFWTIAFLTAMVMSIYLATQSVDAWAVRLIFSVSLTFLAWKFWFKFPLSPGPLRVSPVTR